MHQRRARTRPRAASGPPILTLDPDRPTLPIRGPTVGCSDAASASGSCLHEPQYVRMVVNTANFVVRAVMLAHRPIGDPTPP